MSLMPLLTKLKKYSVVTEYLQVLFLLLAIIAATIVGFEQIKLNSRIAGLDQLPIIGARYEVGSLALRNLSTRTLYICGLSGGTEDRIPVRQYLDPYQTIKVEVSGDSSLYSLLLEVDNLGVPESYAGLWWPTGLFVDENGASISMDGQFEVIKLKYTSCESVF